MPTLTSLAPQFLVDDLSRAIAWYERLGFSFDEPWEGFYAIGRLDGLELHLKEAPRNQSEREFRRAQLHLDASAGVAGVDAWYARCVAAGAKVLEPIHDTAWGTRAFSLEDPDGYLVGFGGRAGAASRATIGHPVPELPVAQVERARDYYRDRLGFELGWLMPGKELGAVSREGVAIFFRQTSAPFTPTVHWLFTPELEATHAELRTRGATIVEPLELKPWGLRQFTVEDLDGHRLVLHRDEPPPEAR